MVYNFCFYADGYRPQAVYTYVLINRLRIDPNTIKNYCKGTLNHQIAQAIAVLFPGLIVLMFSMDCY